MSQINTYTTIAQDSVFTYIKQGCCGGTLKVPVTLLTIAEGEEVDVRTNIIKGLSIHSVFVNGSWEEL